MVLSPSPPDDQPGEGAWLDAIRLELSLASRGILILVDKARPERLRDLVLALLPTYPDLEVYTDVQSVYEAPEGTTMVLAPRPEDADFLNVNRPVFARRNLKVVLWCDEATTLALALQAVDFFDWISRRHECPPGVPMHAVYGIRAALCARAPGIAWMGGDLEACFRAALPGRKLVHLDLSRPLPELVRAVRSAGGAWIVCHSPAMIYEWILPHVLQEARRTMRLFMVPSDYFEGPISAAMVVLEGTCEDLHIARRTLDAAGLSAPGRIAALTGLERWAIEIVVALCPRISERSLVRLLGDAIDPGVAVARAAGEVEMAGPRSAPFSGVPAIEIRAFGRMAFMKLFARGIPPDRMKEMARLAVEFAAAAKSLGDLGLAEILARQAAGTTAQIGTAIDHGFALHTLATVLALRGRFEEAEEHLRRALSREESPRFAGTPESQLLLDDLADILTAQGRYLEAEEIVLRKLDELRGHGTSPLLEQAEQRLAHIRDLMNRSGGGSAPT